MTRSRLAILSMLAATSLVGAPHAQDARLALPADSDRGFMEPAVVAADGDEIWATQARWKARFDADGVEFNATLGASAPRNLPVRLSLHEIVRGATAIHRGDATAMPTPSLSDQTVRYAHTAGIEETYDVTEAGIKQSFVFAERPTGEGDLVVRLTLDTELRADAGTFTDGVTLFHGANPVVGIGQVVGIDAAGLRQAGELRYDGTHLDLVLPSAFVDTASYPLVLDPLIASRYTLDAGSGRDTDPQVAYDDTTGHYLVVWTYEVSATDHDIYAQRTNTGGQPVGNRISVDVASSEDATQPAVCNVNLRDAFFVAEIAVSPSNGRPELWGRAVSAATGALGTFLLINASPVANSGPGRPALCGERTTGPDDCMIVYQNTHIGGIWQEEIQINPDLSATVARYSQVTSDASARSAAICKSFGDHGRAIIAWASASRSSVRYRAIDRNSNFIGSERFMFNTQGSHDSPTVDGDGVWFNVTSGLPITATGDRRIWTCSVEFANGDIHHRSGTWLARPAGIQSIRPSVAMTRSSANGAPMWAVTWLDDTNSDIYVTNIRGGNITELCGPVERVDMNEAVVYNPRIASRWSAGSNSWDALISHMGWNGAWTVRTRAWETFRGGTVVDRGGQVGFGGTYTIAGVPAIGNDIEFRLTGANGGAGNHLCVWYLAIGHQPILFPCGNGVLMAESVVGIALSTTNGAVTMPLRIPCQASLDGLQLSTQFHSITPGVGPCLPDISGSNWLNFTIRP